jgi:chromatin remodeling complex protein RSC6
MGDDQTERLASALEILAESVARIADVFERRFPQRRPAEEVIDATVTHRQTEEEQIREAQGYSEESDEEWIGRRETRFNQTEANKAAKQAERRAKTSRSH